MRLELEDEQGNMQVHSFEPGMAVHIAPMRKHRMQAVTDVELLEVSTTELDDVIRHEDDYGRSGSG